MRAFINTIRLAHSLIVHKWLPEAPVKRLFHEFSRPSPHGPDHIVNMMVGMHHARKTFTVPAGSLPVVLRVYEALMQRQIPHAIEVEYLKVSGFPFSFETSARVSKDHPVCTPAHTEHVMLICCSCQQSFMPGFVRMPPHLCMLQRTLT
jgi:hypothetical protein